MEEATGGEGIDRRTADELLDGEALVPVIEGAVADARVFERRFLDRGIPVAFGAPPKKGCCSGGGCGCSGKLQVLVRPEDAPKVADLLREDWLEALRREGTVSDAALAGPGETGAVAGVEAAEGEELPCPACGTAAPLVEGACSDCGLQLE